VNLEKLEKMVALATPVRVLLASQVMQVPLVMQVLLERPVMPVLKAHPENLVYPD
jgi:hypothetical protein